MKQTIFLITLLLSTSIAATLGEKDTHEAYKDLIERYGDLKSAGQKNFKCSEQFYNLLLKEFGKEKTAWKNNIFNRPLSEELKKLIAEQLGQKSFKDIDSALKNLGLLYVNVDGERMGVCKKIEEHVKQNFVSPSEAAPYFNAVEAANRNLYPKSGASESAAAASLPEKSSNEEQKRTNQLNAELTQQVLDIKGNNPAYASFLTGLTIAVIEKTPPQVFESIKRKFEGQFGHLPPTIYIPPEIHLGLVTNYRSQLNKSLLTGGGAHQVHVVERKEDLPSLLSGIIPGNNPAIVSHLKLDVTWPGKALDAKKATNPSKWVDKDGHEKTFSENHFWTIRRKIDTKLPSHSAAQTIKNMLSSNDKTKLGPVIWHANKTKENSLSMITHKPGTEDGPDLSMLGLFSSTGNHMVVFAKSKNGVDLKISDITGMIDEEVYGRSLNTVNATLPNVETKSTTNLKAAFGINDSLLEWINRTEISVTKRGARVIAYEFATSRAGGEMHIEKYRDDPLTNFNIDHAGGYVGVFDLRQECPTLLATSRIDEPTEDPLP